MARSTVVSILAVALAASLSACAHEGDRPPVETPRLRIIEPEASVDSAPELAQSELPPAPPWEDLDWHEEGDVVLARLSGEDRDQLEARGVFVGGMLLRRTRGLGELTVQARADDPGGRLLEIRGDEIPRAAATRLLQGLKESRALLDFELRLIDEKSGELVVGPMSVSVFAGQVVQLSVENQIAYVKDFDVKIGGQAAVAADPIIDVLNEGIELILQPFADPDGRIEARLAIRTSAIARPIRTFTTNLANGRDITIQLPELEIRERKTDVVIPESRDRFTITGVELPRSDGDGGFVIDAVRLEGRLLR